MGKDILISYWPFDTIHVTVIVRHNSKRYTSMTSNETTLYIVHVYHHVEKQEFPATSISILSRGDIACWQSEKNSVPVSLEVHLYP